MKTTDPPIQLDFRYPVSKERVWNALTNIDEMLLWYFNNIPDFKAEVGFKTAFLISNEGRDFTHVWEVTEVVPNEKITYNWQFEEYPGSSDLTFELIENGDHTILKTTVAILKDFEDDIPEFKRESCIGGWQYFLGGNLKSFLDKKT